MKKEKLNEEGGVEHTESKETSKASELEKPLTLVVKIRRWDKSENKIVKYIYEFSDMDKYAKITRTPEGYTQVLVDVGHFANPKAGLFITGEGLIVPPEGLIINL